MPLIHIISAGPFILTIPNMFLTTLHASDLKVAPGGRSCYTEYRTGLNTGTGIKVELLFSLTMWLYSILLKLVFFYSLLFVLSRCPVLSSPSSPQAS